MVVRYDILIAMKRLKDEFLNEVNARITLEGLDILEIGCGMGSRSVAIAGMCRSLQAIEPDATLIESAKEKNSRDNIQYQCGVAEKLPFADTTFDTVIFTLSFHHIEFSKMPQALDEAVRVTKVGGHIVFLEPAFQGSYFEAEIQFDAGDGDERAEKARAYSEMLNYNGYKEIAEIADETIFQLDSEEDFIVSFDPKKNLENISEFLIKHNNILNAHRRINIFSV